MGYKASMITIKQPSATIGDEELLAKLGFTGFAFAGETTLGECIYPRDKSVSIGNFNDCLIICEDYQLTTSLEATKTPGLLSGYEKILTALYPDQEILTVACHSVVDYHLYSLVKHGRKLRYKCAVGGERVIEFGEWMEEEEKLYAESVIMDGERMFKSPYEDNDVFDNPESSFMEEFAFGVAKRHLGVMISTDEDEELMSNIPFRKYSSGKVDERLKGFKMPASQSESKKGSWLLRLFKKS